jgi:hypothetical protein
VIKRKIKLRLATGHAPSEDIANNWGSAQAVFGEDKLRFLPGKKNRKMTNLYYTSYIPKEILNSVKGDKGIFQNYDYSKFLDENCYNLQMTKNELLNLKKFPLDKDFVMKYDSIASIFSDYFNFDEDIFGIIETLIKDSKKISSIIKYYYNRIRPYQLAEKMCLDIDNYMLDTMTSPSFPSGHALQSHLIANYLGNIYPEHKKNLLSLAKKICLSRLSAKAHFLSDIKFGKLIGEDMADFLLNSNINLNVKKMPYDEEKFKDYVIRTFSKDIAPDELKWHTDGEDRTIIPLNKSDWMIQIDNELPKLIQGVIYIPEGKYHRVIKGSTDLKVKIIKEAKKTKNVKKTKKVNKSVIKTTIKDLLGTGIPKNIDKAFDLAKKINMKVSKILAE